MNTNNNVYTVVYTTVVCVLVAAILAFASMTLKDKQVANEKAETISQILTAAQFGEKSEWSAKGNDAVLAFYKENIAEAYLINAEGERFYELPVENATICTTSELKAQNRTVKAGESDFRIPVYTFKNGTSVLAIYGAGLWGPVWGYVAFNAEGTIAGAYFDHESETPGLGGKIKDDPSFRAQFAGKVVNYSDERPFHIVKGGAPAGMTNGIDAITGASMTSKGLDEAICVWLQAYKPFFTVNPTVE